MVDHEFMFFHLGDAFFFMNEIIKTQPTSQEESELFLKITNVKYFLFTRIRKTNEAIKYTGALPQ